MSSSYLESSFDDDDDDDLYLNAAAKLRALKTKRVEKESQGKEETLLDIGKLNIQDSTDIPTETIIASQRSLNRGNTSKCQTGRKKQRDKNEIESDSDLEQNNFHEDPNLSFSIEEENYDVNVKILWRSKEIHRLKLCKQNENFQKIFDYFANLEQISVDKIMIMKKERHIKKNDTPTSINLSVIDILEGGVKEGNTINDSDDKEEDTCLIKVQTTRKKEGLTIRVKQNENFKTLLKKCAQDFDVEESKIKLYFDGEKIDFDEDTPDSLEIEEEACFDLRL